MKEGFYEVKSVVECRDILAFFPVVTRVEQVALEDALHRVAALDVTSMEDLPASSRSSMDGYAVRARDCFGASEGNPVYLQLAGKLAVNEYPQLSIHPGECAQILTGGTLPSGADAVVMWEHTREITDDEIEVFKSVSPGDNLMLQGEDCQQGQVVLKKGTRIRPQELGVLSALGQTQVTVYSRPQVAILSTGDELVSVHEKPGPGQIRDVNSMTLAAWCARIGANPVLWGILPDKTADLQSALAQAVDQADCVLLSGGSSVGTRDLSVEAISGLPKGRIMAHGVAISPGKPTILAAQDKIPIIGIPGQVTSAQVVMYVLGLPFLAYLGGEVNALDLIGQSKTWAKAARNISSEQGREDYVRVKLVQDDQGVWLAEPVFAKSGLLRSLLKADGLLVIPAQSEGVRAGQICAVHLL